MRSLLARGAAVAGVAALVLVPTATAVAAPKARAPKPVVKPVKPVKPVPVRFTAVGTLDSVTAGTLMLTVSGGSKDLRAGLPLTVAVPATAKVTRDSVRTTVGALVAGDAVTVVGLRTGAGPYTATHVNATAPVLPEPEPTADPVVEPTPAV